MNTIYKKFKNNKLIFIALIMSALLFFSASYFLVLANSDNVSYSTVVLEDEYEFNSKFEIPNSTVTIGSETYDLNSYIIYPSGVHSNNSSNILNEYGRYKVVYHLDKNDKLYTQEYFFDVYEGMYSIDGQGAIKYYENYEKLGNVSGLEVVLYNGDVFHYNKAIDVRDMTKYNTLCSIVNITEKDVFTFGSLYIKLEDILDPTNYVLIKFNKDEQPSYQYARFGMFGSWVKAGASNQQITFGDGSRAGEAYSWGQDVYFSMAGNIEDRHVNKEKTIADCSANFIFDNDSKTVYVSDTAEDKLLKIADLDDNNMFEDVWNGFTSNKANLSFYVADLKSSSATLFVKDIFGANLNGDVVEDDGLGPDFVFSSEPVNVGAVGIKYNFSEPIVSDENGVVGKVTKLVYRDYYSSSKTLVSSTREDFIPTEIGKYYIEYSAKDIFGNIGKKVIVVDVIEAPIISIDNNISDSVLLGVELDTTPTIIGCVNDFYVYETLVQIPNESTEFKISNNSFIPKVEGKYVIKYLVKDIFNRTIEKEIDFIAEKNNEILFYDDIEKKLPWNFIVGNNYALPILTGYDFSTGILKEVSTKIKINGVVIDGNNFKPTETGKIVFEYVLEDGETTIKSFERVAYSITNNDELDTSKMFILQDNATSRFVNIKSSENNGEEQDTKKYVNIKFTNDSSATFLNLIPSNSFNFTFRLIKEFETIDGVETSFDFDVVFKDINSNEQIIVRFFIDKNETIQYNILGTNSIHELTYTKIENIDGVQTESKVSYKLSDEIDIVLSYDNTTRTLSVGQSKYVIKKQSDGDAFKGFSSEMLSLSINYNKKSDNCAISTTVLSICDHVMSDVESDFVKPRVLILEDAGGCYSVGDKVTLPKAIAVDTISPTISWFKVTVKSLNNNRFVKDVNGLELNEVDVDKYTFTISEVGSYKVTYYAEDLSGNSKEFIIMYYCIDQRIPEISLIGNYATTAKVGASVKLADVEAKFGDSSLAYNIYLRDTNGTIKRLDSNVVGGSTITLNKSGTYTVYYYAISDSGRTVFTSYKIICS